MTKVFFNYYLVVRFMVYMDEEKSMGSGGGRDLTECFDMMEIPFPEP